MACTPRLALITVTSGKVVSDRVLEDNWNVAVGAPATALHPAKRTFVGPNSSITSSIDGGSPK